MAIKSTYVELPSYNQNLGNLKRLAKILEEDKKSLDTYIHNINNLIGEREGFSVKQKLAIRIHESESSTLSDETWWAEIVEGSHNWYAPCHNRYLSKARNILSDWKIAFPDLTPDDCLEAFDLLITRGAPSF